jgi:hypothetical protein
VTPTVRAAARNNADWCALVCRSHGIPSTVSGTAWRSARRPPRYYPDAVTLSPDATPADVLAGIDTGSPGCSIKDSFAMLDLASDGFVELFTAQWIHHPARLPAPATPALRTVRVTTASQLRDWQAAWHGGDQAPDVLRPALLADPSVRVLAFHDGEALAGGVILNRGSGLVGLSNLFTTGAAVWSSAITAASVHFPGLPLVGYEHGDELALAVAAGFVTLGTLRVWMAIPVG